MDQPPSPRTLSLLVRNSQTELLSSLGGGPGLAARLGCSVVASGLPATFDFKQQRVLYGKNELALPRAPSYLGLVFDGLHDATILMLIAAAIVSLVIAIKFEPDSPASYIEGAAILGTVLVVLNVQAWTDYRTASTFRHQQIDLENSKLGPFEYVLL